MSNIGQLLHKLTKYQSLYGFVADDGKKALYSQKIAYYKQQLQQAGIDQNNINGVQNLVGGDVYKQGDKITENILAKLAKTPTASSDKEEKELFTAISKAEKSIEDIRMNYDNTLETVRKIISDIQNKILTHGAQPVASVLPDILSKIKKLESDLSELKSHTSQEKFSDNMRTVQKITAKPSKTAKSSPSKTAKSSTPKSTELNELTEPITPKKPEIRETTI